MISNKLINNFYFIFLVALLLNCYSIAVVLGNDMADASKYISNFYKVDSVYYRGGQPSLLGYRYLKKTVKIKTIIDLRSHSKKKASKNKAKLEKMGFNYINIALNPFTSPGKEQIDKFLKIINTPKCQPVYVHCFFGNDRTGLMTAIYRIVKYNWTFAQAYEEMKNNGYKFYLLPWQKYYLKAYYYKDHLAYKSGKGK